MALTARHGNDVGGNEPSPVIWNHFDKDLSHRKMKAFWEDFTQFGASTAVSSNVGRYGGNHQWRSYEDTSDAITQLATNDLGIANIAVASTNNNESWLQPGEATSVFGTVKSGANGGLSLGFEARVAFGQATTTHNAFIGMTEEGLAAADTITDSGALASKDAIGFLILEADGTTIDFVYRKAGQSMVTLIDAVTYDSSGSTTIAASTYYKLGFLIDMLEPDPNKRGKIFVNGIEQGTYITDTILAAATFPAGEELHALLGMKNANAAVTMQIDWVRMMQPRS